MNPITERLLNLLERDPLIACERDSDYPKLSFQLVTDDRSIIHFKDTDGTRWSISLQRGWEVHP